MEEFRIIKDYDYEVSNFGNVRNINTGRILKQNRDGSGYYCVDLRKKNVRTIKKIHRLVAEAFIPNPNNKKCVDHINNDRHNNNIENLRWVSYSENNMNKSMHQNNTSGIVGVLYCKKSKKWKAQITINKKQYNLGYFNTKEEAVEARLKKSTELFGEYQNQNEKNLIIELNIKNKSKRNIILKVNIENEDDEIEKLEKELKDLLK